MKEAVLYLLELFATNEAHSEKVAELKAQIEAESPKEKE